MGAGTGRLLAFVIPFLKIFRMDVGLEYLIVVYMVFALIGGVFSLMLAIAQLTDVRSKLISSLSKSVPFFAENMLFVFLSASPARADIL